MICYDCKIFRYLRIEELQKSITKETAALETYDQEIERLRNKYGKSDKSDNNEQKSNDNNDNNDNNNNNDNNTTTPGNNKAEASDNNNNNTNDDFEVPREIVVAKEKINELLLNYRGELEIIEQSTQEIWEIESWEDYPSDSSKFCGMEENARRRSWFVIQNINHFGRNGGFDATIQRIGHALCPVPTSDLVNLIRPAAQV